MTARDFDAWDTFKAMFDVLDPAYAPSEPPEKLRYFLSEANPQLWADKSSADPAIYSEFREMFESMFPAGRAEPVASADLVQDFLARMQDLYRFVDDISDDLDVDFLALFGEITEERSWPHFFGIEPNIGPVCPKELRMDELELLRSLVGKTLESISWEPSGADRDR